VLQVSQESGAEQVSQEFIHGKHSQVGDPAEWYPGGQVQDGALILSPLQQVQWSVDYSQAQQVG